jgi:hypothetical protein
LGIVTEGLGLLFMGIVTLVLLLSACAGIFVMSYGAGPARHTQPFKAGMTIALACIVLTAGQATFDIVGKLLPIAIFVLIVFAAWYLLRRPPGAP